MLGDNVIVDDVDVISCLLTYPISTTPLEGVLLTPSTFTEVATFPISTTPEDGVLDEPLTVTEVTVPL